MGGTRWNLKSFADREPVAMIGSPCLDGELTSQHEIMVRALAVIMPGNDIAIGQRKDTNLNVRADNDGLDAFHLVVGHLDAFRPNQAMFGISMAPMTRRENRQPVGRIAGYA